jgi:hypothetical protein
MKNNPNPPGGYSEIRRNINFKCNKYLEIKYILESLEKLAFTDRIFQLFKNIKDFQYNSLYEGNIFLLYAYRVWKSKAK